jgi:hypothetical protein
VSPYLQIRLINIDEAHQNLDSGREHLAEMVVAAGS